MDRPGERALAVYRVVFVACIVVMSVRTAWSASRLADHHFWLAAIEVAAALLLLARRTQRGGLALLLVVFAVAAVHGLLTGRVPVDLVLYGASAMAIVAIDLAISGRQPARTAGDSATSSS
jgi:hypothetical protein